MKLFIMMFAVAFCVISMSADARPGRAAKGTGAKSSSTVVHGYVTKRGKYVAPHRRSTPDDTKRNNWSTKGNVNPNTGKPGSK